MMIFRSLESSKYTVALLIICSYDVLCILRLGEIINGIVGISHKGLSISAG